jgi:hypothetical protein
MKPELFAPKEHGSDEAVDLTHPSGELEKAGAADWEGCVAETYTGKLWIRWGDSAAVTTLEQMPVLVDFLKTSGLWDGSAIPLAFRLILCWNQPLLQAHLALDKTAGSPFSPA